jgi:HD superfamily phosphodiesterase
MNEGVLSVWNAREIETATKDALIRQLGKEPGEERFALYLAARKALVEEVLPQIKAVQPNLTDHGPEHVRNVLDNAHRLLGAGISDLTGLELYCLILAILFHDVGNVLGRDEHQKKVAKVYDFVRSKGQANKPEKYIVLKSAEAHRGKSRDGSSDTLRHVDETSPFDGQPVRLRQIAAILRLADELAEGPQRTSAFMIANHKYPQKSQLYHSYASVKTVDVDRGNERIALTYHIDVNLDASGNLSSNEARDLRKLLTYCYQRISKLNQERQYAKHYAGVLSPFKKTTVTFNFWINGQHEDLGLTQATLTDLVVPGDVCQSFVENAPSYSPRRIVTQIRRRLSEGQDP